MTVRISNTSGDGLRLLSAGSRVNVGGDATFTVVSYNSIATSSGSFTEGELHVRGDFTQTREYQGSIRGFIATGTKVVFDGSAAQDISFSDPGSSTSRFADVDVSNAVGATFTSSVTATGDLDLVGKLTVSSGKTFDLTGTLTLRSASTLVNTGTTNVGGCVKESGHTITGPDPCP